MQMIAQITVTRPCWHVIQGRLYRLKSGDVLRVAQRPGDLEADIWAHEAKAMLLERCARVEGEEDDDV